MFKPKSALILTAGFLTIFSFLPTWGIAGEVTRTGRNGRTFTTEVDREYNPATGEINTTRTGENGRSINSTYSIDRSNREVDAVHTTGNGRVLRSTTRTINPEQTEVDGEGVNGRNIRVIRQR